MRQETIDIFTYDELSDAAKEKARDWFRSAGDYAWTGEWVDSLEEWADALDISIKGYTLGAYCHSYVDVELPWYEFDPEEMTGLRLRTWLINNYLPHFAKGKYYSTSGEWIDGKYHYKFRHSNIFIGYNDCPLTGYCGDCSLIEPILEFIKNPNDWESLKDIIDNCISQFVKEYQADMQGQDEDEYVEEAIISNEYEFTADGKRY